MLRKENSGKQDNRNETEYDKIKQQPTGNENNSNKQNITYRREKQKKKKNNICDAVNRRRVGEGTQEGQQTANRITSKQHQPKNSSNKQSEMEQGNKKKKVVTQETAKEKTRRGSRVMR